MSPLSVSLLARKSLWSLLIIMRPITLSIVLINKTILIEWTIIHAFSTALTIPIILDPTGLIFSLTVLFISSNVLHFANTYIIDEVHIKRFTYLVLAFVASMNLLIFIPHIITLIIGWDGLGLTSFLLVIYYQNPKSLAAGIITALTNRIGDVLILVRIALTLNQGHWLIISIDFHPLRFITCIFIIIAAMTKRAQIPFSRWLPAAMAAPTPVSALVHSSTLVTAGVFLLIRFYPFLHHFPMFHYTLLTAATLTIFIAGINALAEADLKKIIALSTLRQLGVMIASLGLGLPTLAFFHLVTHALFKALLFVCAGTLIHIHHHSQDLRTVGNLAHQIPLTTTILTAANAALCGLPFIAGFYSKDLIIEISLFNSSSLPILVLFLLATAMTAGYSIRIMSTSLWSPNMSLPIQMTSDQDTNTTTPMLLLGLGAVIRGAAFNWIVLAPLHEPFLPGILKWSPFLLTILGGYVVFLVTTQPNAVWTKLTITHNANALIWFLAPLSTQFILKPTSKLNHLLLKVVDQGWIELLGGQGMNLATSGISKSLQSIQKTSIITHLTLITLVLMLFISCIDSLNKARLWRSRDDITSPCNIYSINSTLAFHARSMGSIKYTEDNLIKIITLGVINQHTAVPWLSPRSW